MAEYEDQFQQHPVHELLNQLEAAVAQKFKHKLEGTSVDHSDRLQQGIGFIKQQLEAASLVLNSAARMNGLSKGLQNALNEINQFVANGNAAHLANASNHIDGPIATAATMPSISGAPPSIAVEDAVSFKKVAEQVIEQLRSQVANAVKAQEAFQNQAKELADKVDAVRAKLESVEAAQSRACCGR